MNFGNITTVTVSSNTLPPIIKCWLMFLLNVFLEIGRDIFRDAHIGSDIIHATPIQIN